MPVNQMLAIDKSETDTSANQILVIDTLATDMFAYYNYVFRCLAIGN